MDLRSVNRYLGIQMLMIDNDSKTYQIQVSFKNCLRCFSNHGRLMSEAFSDNKFSRIKFIWNWKFEIRQHQEEWLVTKQIGNNKEVLRSKVSVS